jgi:hypothetical protein
LSVKVSVRGASLLFAHGLFTPFCHFLCKCLFTVLADVTDAGRTVATEDECEEFSYEIIMKPTILNVHLTLGTSMEAFFYATLADFTP